MRPMLLYVIDLFEAEEVDQMHHGVMWVITRDNGVRRKIRVRRVRDPTRVVSIL